jgi:hypothetical protein
MDNIFLNLGVKINFNKEIKHLLSPISGLAEYLKQSLKNTSGSESNQGLFQLY